MKIAVITGTTSGLGKAIAKELKESGWFTIGISRGKDEICNESYILNLDNPKNYVGLLDDIIKEYKKIDALINNAGYLELKNYGIDEYQEYKRLMRVNLDSVYFGTWKVCQQKEKCYVVNVASVSGIRADPDTVAYGMTKAGVISLTKSFAKLYPRHRINSISPGFFRTNLVPGTLPDELFNTIPIEREGKPIEIGKLVKYIIEEGDYFTGHNFIIDGGCGL